MQFTLILIALVAALFVAMMVLLETGRRLGRRRLRVDPDASGTGAIEGAVFALLGLLIAFTFSGAAARFDIRRQQIVAEANNIGTAWLRLDLLPADAQPELRDLFRQYVDARLAVFQRLPDFVASHEAVARSVTLQSQIWSKSVAGTQRVPDPRAATLLLPALNDMIDITTTRAAAMTLMHPPPVIFTLLISLSLLCSLLAGYGMASSKSRPWTHAIGFAAVMSITLYVIFEVEYPRTGIIRIDSADQLLVDVRMSMK